MKIIHYPGTVPDNMDNIARVSLPVLQVYPTPPRDNTPLSLYQLLPCHLSFGLYASDRSGRKALSVYLIKLYCTASHIYITATITVVTATSFIPSSRSEINHIILNSNNKQSHNYYAF